MIYSKKYYVHIMYQDFFYIILYIDRHDEKPFSIEIHLYFYNLLHQLQPTYSNNPMIFRMTSVTIAL